MGHLLTLLKPTGLSSPMQIPGLTLWLDAKDAATLTLSSGKVVAWTDKSSSGITVTQASAESRPTYDAARHGGSVAFNAAHFLRASGTSLLRAAPGATIFTVALQNDSSASGVVAHYGDYGYDYQLFDAYSAGPKQHRVSVGGTSSVQLDSGVTWPVNVLRQASFAVDTSSGAWSFREARQAANNGVSPFPAFAAANKTFAVGAFVDATVHFTGDICEVLLYARSLSLTERTAIEGYLLRKWGV